MPSLRGFRRTRSIRACSPKPITCRRPALEELTAAGIVLVLDQITDPHNVGAILRTAAAFAVAAIVETTARHSPDATGVLAKSASGALEHVPIVIVQNLARALGTLKEQGVLVVGLDSDASEDLAAIKLFITACPGARCRGKGLASGYGKPPVTTGWRAWIFRVRSKA